MTFEIAIFVLAGLVGGAVNASAGGAKLFVFPLLLATGLPPVAANVTQSVALWPAQFPAVWVYRHTLLRDLRTLARQMIPAVIGALIGSVVLVNASQDAFLAVIPAFLIIAVAAIIVGPQATDILKRHVPAKQLSWVTGILMAAIGFYGGFFGAGMGFMLLAALSLLSGAAIGEVNGAKNLFAVAIQSTAVIPMFFSGLTDWLAAGFVLVGGIAGGYLGARLTQRLPEKPLRIGVATLGVVLTASFLFR
ncbi:MAG: sulfite exporter TauE/SafE family protein [Gammaproteobacteria bacterium]|nr:sulfite exporter TauE/SafE family protein [Gammaproteobacteria bacterium]